MKDELATKLAEVIGGIQNSVARASDFAVGQLPDVAQQYISYGRVFETLTVVGLFAIALTLASFGVLAIIKSRKKDRAGEDNDASMWVVLGTISCAVSFFFALSLIFGIKDFVMVWFAPKIYLIQGLATLIK